MNATKLVSGRLTIKIVSLCATLLIAFAVLSNPILVFTQAYQDANNDLENSRRSLMESYNTQTMTHGGYIIALVVGFLTLVSRFNAFLEDNGKMKKLFFWILIVAIIWMTVYVSLRIVFWSYVAADVTSLQKEDLVGNEDKPLIWRLQRKTLDDFNDRQPLGPMTYVTGDRATLLEKTIFVFVPVVFIIVGFFLIIYRDEVKRLIKRGLMIKNKVELENTDLKRRIQHTEEKLSNIERLIQDLKKQIPDA